MSVLKLSDATFEDSVLKSGRAAMVDVWAPWCGPCNALGPVVEELAGEYGGRVVFGKLSTDENLEVARRFHVAAIPTLLFFKGGRLLSRLVGAQTKDAVRDRLEQTLAAA
ncbi:MAG: thioredoxin, partial [Elusimicrobia bacterium]|nr:thioredoxin [Elusimicrobiota bacterium]